MVLHPIIEPPHCFPNVSRVGDFYGLYGGSALLKDRRGQQLLYFPGLNSLTVLRYQTLPEINEAWITSGDRHTSLNVTRHSEGNNILHTCLYVKGHFNNFMI